MSWMGEKTNLFGIRNKVRNISKNSQMAIIVQYFFSPFNP